MKHLKVTKKHLGAIDCPICGEPATILGYVDWHFKEDATGRKVYLGKGTKHMQYDHEFDLIGGFIKSATRSCFVPNEEIVCLHEGRLTSKGRCLRCKMIVPKEPQKDIFIKSD